MMKVNIREDDLRFDLTSSVEDDSYDYEVWYKDSCLLVFNMNENYITNLHFGNLDNYIIPLDLLNKIEDKAIEKLKEKITEWNKFNQFK